MQEQSTLQPSVIEPNESPWTLDFKEIWRYRDLMLMLVKRNFVVYYKQTILGPFWYLIQPLLSTVFFTVIFGQIAKISTDGLPQVLFYLAGITAWNYFADCLNQTSDVFIRNAGVFGKVYFPRIVVPISVVLSNLLKFGIQLLIYLAIYLYFLAKGAAISPNITLLLFPLLVLMMGGLGLGFGTIISSLTVKYRDLTFLISFGVQLMMYATPIIYPMSTIPEQYKPFILANPMSGIVEAFKYSTLGTGHFSWALLGYSFGFTVALLFIALVVFNRTQKNFIDTI